ncbi:hypothetical protein ACU6ZR_12280 [Klebsiella aerogenes]
MTKSQLTDLRTLILSEVGDFFAVFGSPGEPETPEEMQRELSMRLGRILNNHIVNYPRCEVLVEILRECRTARDEAQAELQERRKADSEPAMYVMGMGQALDAETASTCKGAVDSWVAEWNQSRLPGQADYKTVPLYRHAQPEPVEVRNKLKAEALADLLKDAREYAPLTAEQWELLANNWHQTFVGLSGEGDTCRAAMLQAEPVTTANKLSNSPVIPDGLIAAVNHLLDSDGSRGCYSAIQCGDAHDEIERLLAAALQEEKTERKK